jgi:stage V sporulation protein AF
LAKRTLYKDLAENLALLSDELGVGISFDVIVRDIRFAGRNAALVFVDGFIKDKVTADIMRALFSLERGDLAPNLIDKLATEKLPYFEVERTDDFDKLITEIISGPMALLVDGYEEALIIDVREYPVRSMEEPDLERVTRGSRDGFVETAIFNTILLRRRLRDPGLRFEALKTGERSKTDVIIAYIDDLAEPGIIQTIKEAVASVDTIGLPMGVKSLEEYIVGSTINPLPKVRYSERPDVVAAHLLEGHVAVIVDTTPAVMITPATAWHFTQHAEEYFQHPTVGTYLRWIRAIGILLSFILTPLWLGLVMQQDLLPEFLSFIGPKEPGTLSLFTQFLILELGVDLVRMAFIHTPNALATSLGIVGAILLGEFAVQVGLFTQETILYTAVAAVGTFATPSVEFGLAVRLFRLLTLILTGLFALPGLAGGVVFTCLVFALTRSFDTPYLWPLIPFQGDALWRLIFRSPVPELRQRPPIAKKKNQPRQS